jgi:hypothetical protein
MADGARQAANGGMSDDEALLVALALSQQQGQPAEPGRAAFDPRRSAPTAARLAPAVRGRVILMPHSSSLVWKFTNGIHCMSGV